MASVKVDVATTATALPSGVTFDHIAVVLVDGSGVSQTNRIDGMTETSTMFTNVSTGNGTVTATAFDSANNAIGNSVSGSFNVAVPVPPATYPAPSGVTVTPQ